MLTSQNSTQNNAKKTDFKARKIPKSHKIPFMVYHSTKNLTNFKNMSKCEKDIKKNMVIKEVEQDNELAQEVHQKVIDIRQSQAKVVSGQQVTPNKQPQPKPETESEQKGPSPVKAEETKQIIDNDEKSVKDDQSDTIDLDDTEGVKSNYLAFLETQHLKSKSDQEQLNNLI